MALTKITDTVLNSNKIGNLSGLQTSTKSDLVAAVNENTTQLAENTTDLVDRGINVMMNGAKADGTDDTSVLQTVLNSFAGKTIVLPYGKSFKVSSLTVPANTKIMGYGARIYNNTTHATLLKLNSGVEITGLEIEGMGNSVYDANGIGIEIKGAWNPTLQIVEYVSDIKLIDCKIHKFGAYGIYAEYAQRIKVSGGEIRNVGYAGIGGMSVNNIRVYNKTLVKEVSPGTNNNAYGIFFSRKSTTTDLIELPHSSDCSVEGCTIEDVPLWEGLDTHGGQNIDFINNTVKNCRVGIALVSIDDLSGTPVYAPKNSKVHGNTIYGIGTGVGIVAIGALTIVGSPVEYADRISIQGNNLTNCGIKGNDAAGGIEIYGTRGSSIVGNTLLDCYPHGISMYHTNEGFTVQGNTIVDPQDETVATVSCIIIRSTHNKGVISGNSLMKVKPSTTDPVLNVAKRGITLSTSTNNEINLGSNFNNCEIKQIGTEGQAVIFGSLLSTTNIATYAGNGSPEGVITAPMGSMYRNKTGGAGTTLYIKESGSGNTGWIGK